MKLIKFVKECTQEDVVKYFVERNDGKFDYIKCNVSKEGVVKKSKYLAEGLSQSSVGIEIRHGLLNRGYTEIISANMTGDASMLLGLCNVPHINMKPEYFLPEVLISSVKKKYTPVIHLTLPSKTLEKNSIPCHPKEMKNEEDI